MAKTEDYRIEELTKQNDPFKQFFFSMEEEAMTRYFGERIMATRYVDHIFRALKNERHSGQNGVRFGNNKRETT